MPVEIFYSYAHEDEALRDELQKHLSLLKRQGLIGGWHDRMLSAGQEWGSEIDRHVNSADIILLLVSPDFLASDYCYNVEMKTALQRHKQSAAVVIPIILRPVDWSGAPFGHLQALPRDGTPVTSWPNRDEAFKSIAQGIREVVDRDAKRTSDSRNQAQYPTRQRVLDAAMPGKIVKDQTTELQTLIRLPDSHGLKGILQADTDAEPRPEDVVSKEFSVTFPRNLNGELEAFTAHVTLIGPDFKPPRQTKRFIVPPEQDSEVISFLLTPQRTGKLKILVELQWDDAIRGARRLLTECVADASAIAEAPALHLVQIPLNEQDSVAIPLPEGGTTSDRTVGAGPKPSMRRRGPKAAWIGAFGTVVAALIAGVFSWYNNGVSSHPPVDNTPRLRVRVVDQATGVGLPAAKVTADTEKGARVGYTDSEGYLELALPSTDNSIRLMVFLEGYEPAERRVASTVFKDGETVRLVRPASDPPRTRALWERNWRTVNEPRPQMGSSATGSWTTKSLMLQMLRALDLSTAPDLAQKRDQLITLVDQADTNPSDPNYDVRYTPDIRNAENELKRGIRDRAIDYGVTVTVPR
jgi:hypothetical protein